MNSPQFTDGLARLAIESGAKAPSPIGVAVGGAGARIWGMTSAERLQRIFRRIGLESADKGDAGQRGLLAAHAGWVFDESLIRALASRPGVVLVDAEGAPAALHAVGPQAQAAANRLGAGEDPRRALPGLVALDALAVGSAYNSALRKREPPVLEALSAANARAVEERLFQGSYKGVTDLVTKYVWPLPARIVTRWCALAAMTPNQVTFASFLLVLAAFWLFWTGRFAEGLAAAWAMTFLDTVDGKLARVTLTSSRIGNVFDHSIDLIHPPFWWWAWLVGTQAGSHPIAQPALVLVVIVGGYVAQRLEEGAFLALFKVEMHAWRRFDSFFRLITARRNPNLILLTLAVLAGRPDIGLVAVAVWTAICLGVHLVQILQALARPKGQIVSWLSG
jgi:phosphatidylglycerophosphate synthase